MTTPPNRRPSDEAATVPGAVTRAAAPTPLLGRPARPVGGRSLDDGTMDTGTLARETPAPRERDEDVADEGTFDGGAVHGGHRAPAGHAQRMPLIWLAVAGLTVLAVLALWVW